MEPKPATYRRKWLRTGIVISVLLVLGLFLRETLRSDWFLNYLKSKLELAASDALGIPVHLDEFSGDLTGALSANGLLLQQGDAMLSADSIRIRYRLGSLLRRTIHLEEIYIGGLHVQAQQDTAGVWDLLSGLPESDTTTVVSDPEAPSFTDSWDIHVDRITLDRASAHILIPPLQGDPFRISDLELSATYHQSGGNMDATLEDLRFSASQALLPEPFALRMRADADTSHITLESLLLQAGRSQLEATAQFATTDSTVHAEVLADPLALTEIDHFLDGITFGEEIRAQLGVSGSLQQPLVRLKVNRASGADLFTAEASFQQTENDMVLTHATAHFWGDDLQRLVQIQDMELPQFQTISLQADGVFPLSDWQEKSRGTLALSVDGVRYDAYRADEIRINADAEGADIRLNAAVRAGASRLDLDGNVRSVWAENPDWTLTANAVLNDLRDLSPQLETELSARFRLAASGRGDQGRFELKMDDANAAGQEIREIFARGRVTDRAFLDTAAVVLSDRSVLTMHGVSTLDFEEPVYSFAAQTDGFNLADIQGLDSLDTRLRAQLTIDGKCLSPELRAMDLRLNMDSSWVNGTRLDRLHADLRLDQSILTITNTRLEAEIADGFMEGRVRVDSIFASENELQYQLQLKDLQPLAVLAGADTLRASGEIRGRIERDEDVLQLYAIMDLDQIAYDDVQIRRLVGQYQMDVRERPEYFAELELLGPAVAGQNLQDVRVTSRGAVNGTRTTGNYGMEANLNGTTGIRLEGNFTAIADTFEVRSSIFDIRGAVRTFSQAAPFTVNMAGGVVATDTLILRAAPDGEIMLRAHHVASDSLAMGISAQNVELEAFLKSIMENPGVKGTLTGHANVMYTETRFDLDADLRLDAPAYEDFTLDVVKVSARIGGEELLGSAQIRAQGTDLLVGDVHLPFRLGDPSGFDDDFFELPVKGRIYIPETDLTTYASWFEKAGFPAITGIVSMDTEIRGIAGIPVFDGIFTLERASIATVPVDRFYLGWMYDQSKQVVDVTTELDATGQRALTGKALIPLNLDFRNFEAILPERDHPLDTRFTADNFNLALLTPFIPVEMADRLQGYLGGNVQINGTFGEPEIQGRMALKQGSVHIVPNNVVYRDIDLDVGISTRQIDLTSFSMRGGEGRMEASGIVALDRFMPDRLDVAINARNFTVFDTRDMKASVSMNTQLAGTYLRPEMTGSLTLSNGNIFLSNFGDKTVEDVNLDGDETIEGPSFYDSLAVNMRIQIDPNVWLRNRTSPEMALELTGDMDIIKERGGELMGFGSLGTRQGYAMQYGKRFIIEKGDLNFSGEITNPEMDIVSVYELRVPEDIEIRYLISGTVDEPQFDFSSDPEMDLENIISYTLFGKPFGALFSWQQTFSGGGGGSALARDAAIGVLVDRVENLATEALGIDLLQIDTNRQGETTTTSVKAGKYITDKLFVAVLNELGGSDAVTRVVLEYYVRRNLQLILTQGNDRRSGFDVLWKYEY